MTGANEKWKNKKYKGKKKAVWNTVPIPLGRIEICSANDVLYLDCSVLRSPCAGVGSIGMSRRLGSNATHLQSHVATERFLYLRLLQRHVMKWDTPGPKACMYQQQ